MKKISMIEFDEMCKTSSGVEIITKLMLDYSLKKDVCIGDVDVRNVHGNAQFYVRRQRIENNND